MSGWIGVDLDGTLAEYHGYQGPAHIGAPIAPIVGKVKEWLAEGREVRIFTARVYDDPEGVAEAAIRAWCKEHVGQELAVTCTKDFHMIWLVDDRAIAVETNTGRLL